MSSRIQNLIDKTLQDGARSTKFECNLNMLLPGLIDEDEKDISIMVKTSQFPGKSHDVIDLKFKGRTIPIKGQVKYDNTWTCTFYLSEDHALKKAFEDWIESIDQKHNFEEPDSKLSNNQVRNKFNGYVTEMKIYQQDFDNTLNTIEYTLHNVFPKSVSGIDVDYSSVGEILEFTVEFSYTHYTTLKKGEKKDNVVDTFIKEEREKVDNVIDKFKAKIKSETNEIFGIKPDEV